MSMIQYSSLLSSVENIAPDIWNITFKIPSHFPIVSPGQFINVRVNETITPLLRRPFSIYQQSRSEAQIIFRIIGEGTALLARKKVNDQIEILGPLGNSFHIEDDYETAIIVAGGLGVAPMPILTQLIKSLKKKFVTYIGARTNNQVVDRYLENVFIATDDGSRGSRGTVVDILEKELAEKRYPDPKIFACGPTKMLNNLFRLVKKDNIPCEVSLEGVMACGVGICQGCPVELADDEKRYALMCKDGPVFDIHSLRMPINGFA